MLQTRSNVQPRPQPSLSLHLATTPAEVLEAQRLRYKVFAEELGAQLASREEGIDRDMFDPYCDHLLVREADGGEVVGTYRILTSSQARRLGGFYSEEEFDLIRLGPLRDRLLEVGRSCVHPDYRDGATIAMLWAGLSRYMRSSGHDHVMGCASIGMADGGHAAASLYNSLRRTALCPIEYRVFPRCALPLEALDQDRASVAPPLIKGYLRLGAYVCGEPAWDPDFGTADLLMMLPVANLNPRYARHFLKNEPPSQGVHR
jgi:putative hemolysin